MKENKEIRKYVTNIVSRSHPRFINFYFVTSNRISIKQRFLLKENEYCLILYSCVTFQSRKLFGNFLQQTKSIFQCIWKYLEQFVMWCENNNTDIKTASIPLILLSVSSTLVLIWWSLNHGVHIFNFNFKQVKVTFLVFLLWTLVKF